MLYKIHFTMELLKDNSLTAAETHTLNSDLPGDIHVYIGRDSEGNKCIDLLEFVHCVGIAPVKL